MTNFFIGLMLGVVIGVAVITANPVIAKITHSIGGDTPAKFVVTCQAGETGRVDCGTSDFNKDTENERFNKFITDFRQRYSRRYRRCGF